MILQHRRRSIGCWNDQYQTRNTKVYGRKWSNILCNGIPFIVAVFILCFTNSITEVKASNIDTNILPAPVNKGLIELYSVCIQQKKNNTDLSKNGFATVDIIKDMHFDFCSEFHPAFFIPLTTSNSSYVELTIKFNNFGYGQTIRVSNVTRCDVISVLLNDPDFGINLFSDINTDYGLTLDRLGDCTLEKKINCSLCKVTYSIFSYFDYYNY